MDTYRKTLSVVNSCNLSGQILTALRYIRLAHNQELIDRPQSMQLTALCALRLQVIKINDKREGIA